MKKKSSTQLNLLFFLIHLLAYAYLFHFNDWNSNSRFGLTMAMLERGTLSIDAYHDSPDWQTGDKSLFNGHYYSDKAPGTSFAGALLFLPIFEICQRSGLALTPTLTKIIITLLSIALPAAVAALLVFLVAQKIAGRTGPAFWASIAITLGSMFWPFSTTFFSHSLSGALIFGAFFLGFRAYSAGKDPGWGALLVTGLTLGLALISEYTTAIVIFWVLGYLGLKAWQRGRLSASLLFIGLGALIAILPALIYNWLIFKNPFASGYSHELEQQFASGMSQGLMGIGWPNLRVLVYMTIHPAQGLFWQSPGLLFSLPAFFWIKTSKYKAETSMALGICASMLIILSGYFMWWGGWSFAPRHLTPMLLFLIIPLATLPPKSAKPLFHLQPFLIAAALFSTAQMFLVTATSPFVADDWVKSLSLLQPFKFSVLYNLVLPDFLNENIASNLGQFLISSPFLSLLPLILLESFLFFWFWRISRR